jgi:nicotinamide-nucleotide amidase
LIPTGALSIENPVGTAPIFILETERGVVMTLPGVPREMKYLLDNELLPWLRTYLKEPAVIKSVVLRTAGIGESQIDARITDLMAATNPTVGLAAHSGQTDIRVTAKAMTPEQADEMMAPVVQELEGRLGAWIYGTEKQAIEEAVLKMLAQRGSSLATLEAGSGELLAERLRTAQGAEASIKLISTSRDNVENVPGMALDEQALSAATQTREQNGTDYGLAVLIHSPASGSDSGESGTGIAVAGPAGSRKRYFGWSRERVELSWAITTLLALPMLVNAEEPAR